jgi:hypothetical protein
MAGKLHPARGSRNDRLVLSAGRAPRLRMRGVRPGSRPQPSQARALRNSRIQGPSSPQSSGCQECWTVRNTRSGWGMMTVTRPSALVTPVTPQAEPFGVHGQVYVDWPPGSA